MTDPSGALRPARPTVYNGIKMRSRLEAGFAAWLDGAGFVWEYEPTAFADAQGQYLPDFRVAAMWDVTFNIERVAFIEVRPKIQDAEGRLARQLDIVRASHDVAPLCAVATPDGWQRLSVADGAPILTPASLIRRRTWEGDTKLLKPGLGSSLHDSEHPWPIGYWEVV